MWLMVMFDLPTHSAVEKREYTRFRKLLLKEAFVRLQFSIYAKFCASRSNAEKYYGYIGPVVPPGGYVRLLLVTDKQFGEMVNYYGKNVEEVEKPPEQLLLF